MDFATLGLIQASCLPVYSLFAKLSHLQAVALYLYISGVNLLN